MQTFANHLVALLILAVTPGLAGIAFGQTAISGTVNQYASVKAISGNNKLLVDDPLGFTMNNRILVIQLQGATIDESNNPTFGSITDTGSAGLYEYNTVCGVSGDTLVLEYELANNYSVPGRIQVVGVPQYQDAIVNGPLTALPWNDSTGGIIAIDVTGTLTLSSDIDATGMGFKGGEYNPSSASCQWWVTYPDYYYQLIGGNGLAKGQGVAAIVTNKEGGKGAQGNGGGGGNNHNAGGGGGAHAGAGGKGGDNNEPGSFNCKGFNPGLGGKPLAVTSIRFYFGGGGGSGHGNNMDPGSISSGGAGGGLVFIQADSLIGNGYQISTAGAVGGYSMNDGAGGGGAGGTVVLDVNGFHGSGLSIDVSGGDGGDADNDGQDRCFGPGGGGGGGVVFCNISLPVQVSVETSGGVCGESINSNTCTGPQNAEDGEQGITYAGISITESGIPGTGCATLLPIEGLNVWIEEVDNDYILKWNLLNPIHVERFVVEYQARNGKVKELGEVSAQKEWEAEYSFALPRLPAGKYYVRLGAVSEENEIDHSHWISWTIRDVKTECRVIPNFTTIDVPVTVHFEDFAASDLVVEVFDATGSRSQIESTHGTHCRSLQFPKPGVYFIRLSNGAKYCNSKIIVQP